MNGTVAADVAVSSDRALVAEAMTAALAATSGLEVIRVPWAGSAPESASTSDPELAPESTLWGVMITPPTMAIVVCDLEPASVGPAQRMAQAYPDRCLLLTDAARGPLWGAMLEAGVIGILPSSITLDELVRVIHAFLHGRYHATLPDRAALVTAWQQLCARRVEAVALIAKLGERELDVLRLLRRGLTVSQIAEQHDVAASTVRSQVRSILHKLHVHAQLAAVALLVRAEHAEEGLPFTGPSR